MKQTENTLAEREALLRTTIESLPFDFWALDMDNRTIMQNTTCIRNWGSALGKSPEEVDVDNEIRTIWKNNNKRAFAGETVVGEVQFTMAGGIRHFQNIISPIINKGVIKGILGVNIDITERKKTETELHKYAKSQSILLREVNHRVTNNLSALISIIHKEEDHARLTNLEAILPVLQDFEKRVAGLLNVHRLLSMAGWEDVSLIELCESIVKGVQETIPASKKMLLTASGDHVLINSDRAHHLGIVLNELVTNTFKHAVSDRDTVNILINVRKKNNEVYLSFEDDGPGFPDEIVHDKTDRIHIGFDIIQGIVKNSLEGELILSNDNGAHIIIRFNNEEKPDPRECST